MAPSPLFHILAVDDNLVDRTLIEKLLTTSSYQVTVVDSVTKALRFLGFQENEENAQDPQHLPPPPLTQRVQVNLIITDYCMPGMTGLDLLRIIKGSSTLKDLPVVIMSSENNPSRISRCMEGGADDFLVKPVQMSDVNKLMSHLLRRMAKDGEEGVVESRKIENKLVWVRSFVVSMVWGNMLRRKTQITIFLFSILFFFCPKWLRFPFAE